MALSTELEALMVELEKADPAAAKEQRALLEKYPSLQKPTQEGVMRQSDYDRRLNENKQQIEYGKTMRTWAEQNVPKYDSMVQERDAAVAKAAEAERKLAEKIAAATTTAAAAAGVDPDKLAEAVRLKLGTDIPTKTELTNLVNTETKKLVEGEVKVVVDRFYAQDVPRLAGLNAALTEAQNRYHDEFKDYLDPEAYTAHLAKAGDQYVTDGKFDRKKAYEAFTATKRLEATNAAEIEKRARERADAILAERGVSGNFPGTSGPPGVVQMRFNAKDKADPLFGSAVELGDQSAAAAAAAELHAEGK
jgi:hypothetical protein